MSLFSTGFTLLDISYLFRMTYFVSAMLGWTAGIVVLVVSIFYCRRKSAPPYMRVLPLYFFLSNLTEVLAVTAHGDGSLYVYWLFVFEDVAYLLYFFWLLFRSARMLLYWLAFVITVVPSVWVYIVTRKPLAAASLGMMLESIVLLIPSVSYFRELFQRPKIMVLEKDASFWMVTGIFFYYLIRLPVVWFTGYYYQVNNEAFGLGVYSINNYSLVISYILFIKGMVCLTR